MDFALKLQDFVKNEKLPESFSIILQKFISSYKEAIEENKYDFDQLKQLLSTYIDLIIEQIKNPYYFEPFHQRIITPFNYYTFGLDLIRPLIVFSESKILGLENLEKIETQLAKGDNVILFANHQTEPDPQAISLLLEKSHPKFAEEMIIIAGHRVISDPLAVPLSMGRNLLCIFSKKHIETPPEQKQEKILHNQRTMKIMAQLLSEGGKCIYVAPSGGRDRPNHSGVVDVARFDPQSIEMFWLMANYADKPTHFYPLAMATYKLLPPPNSVEKKLGERRQAHCTPIHLAFGKEIDMENFPGNDNPDKRQKRKLRADFIWELVRKDYSKLISTDIKKTGKI